MPDLHELGRGKLGQLGGDPYSEVEKGLLKRILKTTAISKKQQKEEQKGGGEEEDMAQRMPSN